MSEVTRLLGQIEQGNGSASAELLPLLYEELRKLAASRMAQEPAGQTLDATALVHEAYLRLVGTGAQPQSQQWDSRGHFFAAAAEAMRRILVDNARRKRRPKHGGDRERIDLEQGPLIAPSRADDLLALDEALSGLAAEAPEKAEVVKLRYFAGLSLEECSLALGISLSTAKRHWAYARAWLHTALADAGR